ncbi:MAG: hypothetical protein K2N03_01460, partial [Muribaculaceae bacterium]|nr:hypothetical protein [Muribaculaceae bacterium]
MILSMTGFGRGQGASADKKFVVEIKSLNSKQLDFSMRAPSFLKEVEVDTRNIVAGRLERGKVELSVSVENTGATTPSVINFDLLQLYKSQILELGDRLNLQEPHDWYALLLKMPDAMKTEMASLSEEDLKAYNEALEMAIVRLTEFRATEGARLYRFFCEKIMNISRLLREIEPHEKSRVGKIRARLQEQLEQIDSIRYDEGRLEQELIFYIEKLDVSEEKLRLTSHLDYFLTTLG